MRIPVAIVGAGPAGLLLAHLLQRAGIECLLLESRSRDYVEQRVRAGVLEHGSVQILEEAGVADRLHREGMVHRGIQLRFEGEAHRIDFAELTGRAINVYGQQEVVKDLIAARIAMGGAIEFEAHVVEVAGIDSTRPRLRFVQAGTTREVECDFIAGCDGFHGACRSAIAPARLTIHERLYPFAWLGIVAQAPPAHEELIYAHHERGFALFSMRSPTVTRLYLQVPPEEPIAAWPHERVWEELRVRLTGRDGWQPHEGAVMEKSVTGVRSFVAEPLRHGRLFLAGDAAHIVPPTGAKGMNLALADVRMLAAALSHYYASKSEALLEAYSATCLQRVWRAQHFSWWMTSMLHRFPQSDSFQRRLQLSQLRYVVGSRAAATALAENYVGLPLPSTG